MTAEPPAAAGEHVGQFRPRGASAAQRMLKLHVAGHPLEFGLSAARPSRILNTRSPSAIVDYPKARELATSLTLATFRKARAQQEGAQRWISRLAPLFLIVVIASSIGAYMNQGPAGHNLYVLLAAAVFMLSGMGVLTSQRRPIAVNAGLIVVMLASSAALVWLEPGGTGVAGIFVCLVLLAPRVLDRIPGWLSVAGIVCMAVIAEIGSPHSPASALSRSPAFAR